jgi:hypothetical protein
MPPSGGVIVLKSRDEPSVGLNVRPQKPITSRAREKREARLDPRGSHEFELSRRDAVRFETIL